jgi:lysozyme
MLSPRQRKKARRFVFFSVLILGLVAGAYMLYQQLGYNKARFARYPAFGIELPLGYMVHGIDVSKYQSTIAWKEVKAMRVKDVQMSFAFMKATQSTGGTDPHFKRNWKKAKEAGLIRGAYHFFIASADGKAQAGHFLNTAALETGDLPPVLDIEQLNGTNPERLRAEAKRWLEVVESHYGVKPIIYTNVDFYDSYLGEAFDEYPLWAAHYFSPGKPRIKRDWLFWQHSDQGRVNGIVSKVDFNVFNGSRFALSQILIR